MVLQFVYYNLFILLFIYSQIVQNVHENKKNKNNENKTDFYIYFSSSSFAFLSHFYVISFC